MAERRLRAPAQPFDALTHAFGGLLGVAGAGWLLARADRPAEGVAAAIYLAGLAAMFGSSALYHWVGGREGSWWQRADHLAIYAMIAGTYTPVCLLALRPETGRPLLALQWGLVATGVAINLALRGGPHWVRLVIYVLQGWACAPVIGELRAALTPSAFAALVAGGLAYTGGIVFFATDRRVWPGRRWGHEIWHLFVLAGAGLHFFTVASLF